MKTEEHKGAEIATSDRWTSTARAATSVLMSVFLIQPALSASPAEAVAMRVMAQPSLGLGYLAAQLSRDGMEATIFDLNVDSWDEVAAAIADQGPKIVGITAYTFNVTRLVRIAFLVKELDPSIRVVAGGVHATYDYQRLLLTELVDYVIRSEGEAAFSRLCREILDDNTAFGEVPNLVFLQNAQLIATPLGPTLDLDTLPCPTLQMEKYGGQPVPILTSRGCSFNCIYCSSSAYWGIKMRYRSIDNTREEISGYRSAGHRDYSVVDDNLNINKKYFLQFCSLARELDVRWTANCSLRRLDEELIDLMHDSGCVGISVGIESADPEIQKKTGKVVDLDHALRMVERACQLSMKVECGFILFHYCETPESLQKTIDFAEAIRSKGASARFALNTPFFGTHQYLHRDELGLRVYEDNPDDFNCRNAVIDTPHFRREELKQWYDKLNMQNIDMNALLEILREHDVTSVTDLSASLMQDIIQRVVK